MQPTSMLPRGAKGAYQCVLPTVPMNRSPASRSSSMSVSQKTLSLFLKKVSAPVEHQPEVVCGVFAGYALNVGMKDA